MSTLVATKVKDAEIWLSRFIAEVEALEGEVEKIVAMYGDSHDNTYTHLRHWQRTSRHTVELYRDPYTPPEERHGAMLARVKQDIQKLLVESTAKYYLNLDCDLVRIPVDTIPHLVGRNLDMVAGMVYTEGRDPPHFFDSYLYRLEGNRFHPFRPPGMHDKEPFKVDCASTYYLSKREVELAGKYVNPYPHLTFCDDLIKKGYSVWVDPGIAAHHVDLERLGIAHMPLPIPASTSNFIDYDKMTYTPAQISAEEHYYKRNQYMLELASLDPSYPDQYMRTKQWMDTRPLIAACYKTYRDVEMLSYSVDSIYSYVDEIIIAYGPVKLREKDYPYKEVESKLNQIIGERDYQSKVRFIGKPLWESKEQIQQTLLKECTAKWMLYIDDDEVIEGMDKVLDFAETSKAWYARPQEFINFYADYSHTVYSINPQSPWYKYGLPHPFLINRDTPGLSFGFHTVATDGFGVPLHSDHPANRHRRSVLDGVKVYHYGNAKPLPELKAKGEYYHSRGDKTVYEDSFTACRMDPDMVLEEYTGSHPAAMARHPRIGERLIKVTKTKPHYEYRWLKGGE